MRVIARGYDTDAILTMQHGKDLKNAGADFVARYLNNNSHTEAHGLLAAGLKIVSVFETNPTSAAYFVKGKGIDDAKNAINLAKAIGQPTHSAIYLTADFDVQCADVPAVVDYFREAQETLGPAGYYTGCYAKYDVLVSLHNAGVGGYYWEPASWSNGRVDSLACMYQAKYNLNVCGIPVDLDECYSEPGWWATIA